MMGTLALSLALGTALGPCRFQRSQAVPAALLDSSQRRGATVWGTGRRRTRDPVVGRTVAGWGHRSLRVRAAGINGLTVGPVLRHVG